MLLWLSNFWRISVSNINDKFCFGLLTSKTSGITLSFGYWSVEGVSNAAWLKDTVFGLRKVPEWERKLQWLPKDGKWWSLGTFVVDSSIYLPFLLKKFRSKGGRTLHRSLSNLDELLSEDYDIVINCSGLGAKELASDRTIYPTWGQGKLVEAPWIKHFVMDSMPKMCGANAVTLILLTFSHAPVVCILAV